VILAYCSLSGNWEHWLFLWVFELLIVIFSIWTPVWLAANKRLAQGVSRLIALVGGFLSVVFIVGIGVITGLGSLLASVAGMFGF
jgi:hypothetical protein